jgi:hypothetical protein
MNNCRFTLDERRRVIDAVNLANSGKGYCHEGDPEDDRHLRQRVLMVLLGEMINKLIINPKRNQNSLLDDEHQPFNYARYAIFRTMLGTISASHLNTFDPRLSVQHKFGGKLGRQKQCTRDITSLALFRDDVECLLRDLYGDLESDALDSVLSAIFQIIQQFTRYVRPDLCKENEDAEDLDRIRGAGLPEGTMVSGCDFRSGMVAKCSLINRVRDVNANLSTYSEYTIRFANLFAECWDCSKAPVLEFDELSL